MAETDEQKPKKRRGLGALLNNPEVLFALGSGLTTASRGGDFSAGVGLGLANYSAMEDARINRQTRHLMEQQNKALAARRAEFANRLGPEERALYEMNPDAFVNARIKQHNAGPGKGSSAQQKYQELLALGIDKGKAFQLAYGSKSMRTRVGPDGSVEIYEGFDDAIGGIGPMREQESKFGLYATQALDADKNMLELEKELNPSDPGNAAYTLLRETPGLGRFSELIPNEGMKEYEAESGRFIDGWARAMTGAAMPESERIFYKSMIGIRPGDGPDVIERKARNRRIMAESLQLAAGKGGQISEEVARRAMSEVRSKMVDPGASASPSGAAAKPISEMTPEEIEAELRSLESEGY